MITKYELMSPSVTEQSTYGLLGFISHALNMENGPASIWPCLGRVSAVSPGWCLRPTTRAGCARLGAEGRLATLSTARKPAA